MKPIPYEPRYRVRPQRMIDVPTAWNGIESILHDLICRFCPGGTRALEFGVDYGYSTVALANYFPVVVGIDTFAGDEHAGQRDDGMYNRVRESLWAFPNIRLVRSDYRDFLATNTEMFDLTHIDIVHTYDRTFECGQLALLYSQVVIFHDTRSFPEVMRAVSELADRNNRTFYEWPESHGLGILVR